MICLHIRNIENPFTPIRERCLLLNVETKTALIILLSISFFPMTANSTSVHNPRSEAKLQISTQGISLGNVSAGQHLSFNLTLTWIGPSTITITNVTFLNSTWVSHNVSLPSVFMRQIGEVSSNTVIPCFLKTPKNCTPGNHEVIASVQITSVEETVEVKVPWTRT